MKLRIVTTMAFAAALVAAAPAFGQRASLAERVGALEVQAASNQGNVDLLNQLTALRNEVQALRSQIEELQQQNQQLQESGRSQYLDLDSRLERLEGGGAVLQPPAAAPAASAPPAGSRAAQPALPAPAAPAGDERAAYAVAFDALKAGEYAQSARLFQQFLQAHPSGSYAANARYWLGESYYVTQNYDLAREQFEVLLQQHPTHDKAPGALLKVGLSQYGARDVAAAEATLARVTTQYPGTDAARTADDRLRAIQLGQLR